MISCAGAKKIKAVFFDFGGTLVYLAPSKEELFRKACHAIGLKLGPESVKLAYRIVDFNNKFSSIECIDSKAKDDFYKDYNRKLCEVLGISNSFSRLYPMVRILFKKEKRWKLYKEVKVTLCNLRKRNILLSIIANWDRKLTEYTERLRIRSFFYSIIASQEVNIEKPDPKIFAYAIRRSPIPIRPEQILYIGNEYNPDILAARRAGLIPALIDRDRIYPNADCMRFDSLTSMYNFLVLKDRLDKNI